MPDKVKVGDVVTLKSGGPAMTVNAVEDYAGTMSAFCVWFDAKKQVDGVFPVTSLVVESSD